MELYFQTIAQRVKFKFNFYFLSNFGLVFCCIENNFFFCTGKEYLILNKSLIKEIFSCYTEAKSICNRSCT